MSFDLFYFVSEHEKPVNGQYFDYITIEGVYGKRGYGHLYMDIAESSLTSEGWMGSFCNI